MSALTRGVALLAALVAPAWADAAAGLEEGVAPDGAWATEWAKEDKSGGLAEAVAGAMSYDEGEAYMNAARKHLPEIEAGLSPILATLPKNAEGKFDAPSVRYALHHFFVRHHGWRLKGLDPLGERWNSSTKVAVLETIPPAVRSEIEKPLVAFGLDEHDVAALGMTLKYLIHSEGREKLRAAFRMSGFRMDEPLPEEKGARILESYMAAYLLGRDLSKMSPAHIDELLKEIPDLYPGWRLAKNFTQQLLASRRKRPSAAGGDAIGSAAAETNFAEVALTVEEAEEKYGRHQNSECLELKAMLVAMEVQGTGRVRLRDFYKAGLNGTWQFTESPGYLLELGALDTSVPESKRVIIPNYINGYSNCIGTTSYNDMCCISECEDLMAGIETALATSRVLPEDIVRVVEALPSSTVPGGRKLAVVLRQRLTAIAQLNGGIVPIYGRLFAQWMHHAYPRECPFPHLSGTFSPKNLDDWAAIRNIDATQEEMKYFASRRLREDAPLQPAPWIEEEELPTGGLDASSDSPVAWVWMQCAVSLAMLVVFAFTMARTVSRVAVTRFCSAKGAAAAAAALRGRRAGASGRCAAAAAAAAGVSSDMLSV